MPDLRLSPRARTILGLIGLLLVALLWLTTRPGSSTDASTAPASATSAAAAGRATPGAAIAAPARATSAATSVARTGSTSARTARVIGADRAVGVDDALRTAARRVLAVVDRTGRAPSGYVGGRQFMNDGRGGTAPLPRTAARGSITYHEYDVNPYQRGVDRGPQRLVVGDDGSAWVTGDHYDTWEQLR